LAAAPRGTATNMGKSLPILDPKKERRAGDATETFDEAATQKGRHGMKENVPADDRNEPSEVAV